MTSGVAVVPGPRDLLRLLLPRSRSPPHLPLCLHGRGHQTGGQGQSQAREVNIANGITVSGICQVVLIYAGLQNFFLFVPSHGGSFCQEHHTQHCEKKGRSAKN